MTKIYQVALSRACNCKKLQSTERTFWNISEDPGLTKFNFGIGKLATRSTADFVDNITASSQAGFRASSRARSRNEVDSLQKTLGEIYGGGRGDSKEVDLDEEASLEEDNKI
ncbi:hypothetical protein BDP27DRAFT_1362045 [Rhodocollybia butyracea]|uniref:Uncharacterized protein n=1 Tax=Rhodocollybia butyracea TaxID=206335 RepID=A0A9P5U9S4_9AGAR|nr:hypothetical protein BDP27DRAFT_1362045 [Rhodocollybia butyracea]